MNTIDPSLYLSNQKTERNPSPSIDKNGFLKILMTQLQNQDPTAPMDDQAMVEQMATLTSLEQITNISSTIETFVESQLISPVIEYSHMIGKEVTYPSYDEESEEATEEKSSKVVAVTQDKGWAVLKLDNGDEIYADAVIEVRDHLTISDGKTLGD